MLNVVKAIHWVGNRVSDLGEALFNLGGAIESWADERVYRHQQKMRIKQWQEWTGVGVLDVPLQRFADFSPADLALPNLDNISSAHPRPLTMLDEYKGMSTKQVYDLLTEEEYYEAEQDYLRSRKEEGEE